MTNIIPFGKYKGRSIEELVERDPAYLQWLTSQDWFRDRFVLLHQTIINQGAEPEETPEHNALQVKFLDDEFCQALMVHLSINKELSKLENYKILPDFEYRGADVVLRFSTKRKSEKSGSEYTEMLDYLAFPIEIKPMVGDDYPAVLRQMRRINCKILLVERYTGTGASREQFVETFAAAGRKVVFVNEILVG
jgi:hypothetical protein